MTKDNRDGARAETLTSRHNPLVRLARETREGKSKDLIFVEGLRLCEEVARAGLSIKAVLFAESFVRDARASALIDSLKNTAERIVQVSDAVMQSLSDTKTPQGVVALAERPRSDAVSLTSVAVKNHLLVIMHRVSNPSNAGAMLRVAEAAGATGCAATRHTTDLFSPKSLRGAMGSAFRLPLWTGAEFGEILAWCASRSITTVSTSLDAELSHTEYDWRQPSAIIVGAEGSGLEPEEARACDVAIRIPMRPPVESLNVSTALAVVLYEAARQRESF